MPPSLASRLLFHASPTPPPHLLATKNLPPELNPELYDFIALALRAYVSPWWSKITRYDKDFLPHITRILGAVVRSLELRVKEVDLSCLVFHDIPSIVTQHYIDYRNAAAKTSTSYATGGAASLSNLFAHLQPHMAISSEGILNAEYYRQIIDHILKVCLPAEDYEPESQRIIIREVLVKVVIEDIMPKITQPWFIYKILLDAMGPPDEPIFDPQPPLAASIAQSQPFSFHNLIVIVLSAVQACSGTCLALVQTYKQAITTIKLVQQSPPRTPQPSEIPIVLSTSAPVVPPEVLDITPKASKILQASSLRSVPSVRSTAFSEHHRRGPSSTFSGTPPPPNKHDPSVASTPNPSSSSYLQPSSTSTKQPTPPPPPYQANYTSSPLLLLVTILTLPTRFASSIIYTTLCMLCALFTSFLDKLLPHMLYTFLSPLFILNTVKTAKKTLFPNGYPGPPPVEPTLEEQMEMRRKLEGWRGRGGVTLAIPFILGPDPAATISAALDPLSDPQCNRRLAVFILDRILIALFPELAGGEGTSNEGTATPLSTISRSSSSH
ncbi:PXA domain-containing protein [Crepidotus variabilis]|uniref:PXA domain-containing protein n=1 Tax=Crepidotus variabilis TaxID=179855 RepID=A0A9P6EUU2_9AGAR|nr:PXA domain-containing protein [Crepidotus variabilis]